MRLPSVALFVAVAAGACGESGETSPEPVRELTGPVTAADVTIVYPLPAALGQRTSLVGADASGPRGELLPREIYVAFPFVDIELTNPESYTLLRVLAVRFDPCFPGLGAPCRRQIRMVMQPVRIGPAGDVLVANDAAVHTFYELGADAWESCLARTVALREEAGDGDPGAIGVHPSLAREGVEGPFAKGLRDVLLDCAGRENLVKVTFMALENLGSRWRFGGVDVAGGATVPITIAGIGVTEQTFSNGDLTGQTFALAGVAPPSTSPDAFTLFFNEASASMATDDARLAAYRAALRVENPDVHNPDTIDCVTCHVAAPARRRAEILWGYSAAGEPDAFDGAPPLPGATPHRTNHMRALGYFGTEPSISQRAANETAATVAYVNANLVAR